MITVEHVSKRYEGGITALRDVNFQLARGEMVFLTGHSGAGKSTLLRLVLMLERPSGGKITVNGQELCRTPARHAARTRQRIGMIFQDHKLLKNKSVFDNVALPLMIAGLPYREVRKRVRAALDRVGLLGREATAPGRLSGGEQQRVGIARAIVGMPPVLLADEPTGNLDHKTGADILRILRRLNADENLTIVMVTHDLAIADQADCTVRLVEGQVKAA